jgi:hypothetical protein
VIGGKDRYKEGYEAARERAAILRVWREVERHPGIHIRCNGDEAAGVWNRLAQLVEGRNG